MHDLTAKQVIESDNLRKTVNDLNDEVLQVNLEKSSIFAEKERLSKVVNEIDELKVETQNLRIGHSLDQTTITKYHG